MSRSPASSAETAVQSDHDDHPKIVYVAFDSLDGHPIPENGQNAIVYIPA
jgi:hypothetical protein